MFIYNNIIFFLSFISSFCSLSYELLIAGILSHLTDDVTYWESISIGVFIGSIGLGLYAYGLLAKSRKLSDLFVIELTLSIAGIFVAPFILFMHMVYHIYLNDYGLSEILSFSRPIIIFGLVSQFLNIVIGFLSGLELACLIEPRKKLLIIKEFQ